MDMYVTEEAPNNVGGRIEIEHSRCEHFCFAVKTCHIKT